MWFLNRLHWASLCRIHHYGLGNLAHSYIFPCKIIHYKISLHAMAFLKLYFWNPCWSHHKKNSLTIDYVWIIVHKKARAALFGIKKIKDLFKILIKLISHNLSITRNVYQQFLIAEILATLLCIFIYPFTIHC